MHWVLTGVDVSGIEPGLGLIGVPSAGTCMHLPRTQQNVGADFLAPQVRVAALIDKLHSSLHCKLRDVCSISPALAAPAPAADEGAVHGAADACG